MRPYPLWVAFRDWLIRMLGGLPASVPPTAPPAVPPASVPAPPTAALIARSGRLIKIVLQSSVVPSRDFAQAVAAIQQQITDHFVPAWGVGATLQMVVASPSVTVRPTMETIYILDDSDQAGALGYHSLTTSDVPVGFVFARTTIRAGESWQSCLSHEVLEQLIDPFCNSAAIVSFQGKLAAVAYETADPVEADEYTVNGVPVSNFVLPAWFQSAADVPSSSSRMDYLGRLKRPLTLTRGGYVAFSRDLANWDSVEAEQLRAHRAASKACPYCRRSRRKAKARS